MAIPKRELLNLLMLYHEHHPCKHGRLQSERSRPAQRRGWKYARLALGRFTWPCGFSSPAINSLPAEKRAGLNLRLEFIRPLLFSESEIGTVRQFGPLFGLSHYLSFGWSPWHKSESWSYICAPAFLIPFPAEYRSSE